MTIRDKRLHQLKPLVKLALTSPTRIEILGYLLKKRRIGTSERELADALKIAYPRVVYHLKVMEEGGLIVHVDGQRPQDENEGGYLAASSAGL